MLLEQMDIGQLLQAVGGVLTGKIILPGTHRDEEPWTALTSAERESLNPEFLRNLGKVLGRLLQEKDSISGTYGRLLLQLAHQVVSLNVSDALQELISEQERYPSIDDRDQPILVSAVSALAAQGYVRDLDLWRRWVHRPDTAIAAANAVVRFAPSHQAAEFIGELALRYESPDEITLTLLNFYRKHGDEGWRCLEQYLGIGQEKVASLARVLSRYSYAVRLRP
jgi:hypothetical protein